MLWICVKHRDRIPDSTMSREFVLRAANPDSIPRISCGSLSTTRNNLSTKSGITSEPCQVLPKRQNRTKQKPLFSLWDFFMDLYSFRISVHSESSLPMRSQKQKFWFWRFLWWRSMKLQIFITFFDFYWGHTKKCSGTTPSTVLRGYSCWAQWTIMGARDWTWSVICKATTLPSAILLLLFRQNFLLASILTEGIAWRKFRWKGKFGGSISKNRQN